MDLNNTHFSLSLEALKDSSFFKDIDTQALGNLLSTMTRSSWSKGTFKNGNEISTHLYFITSGRLKMYQINPRSGREHTIMILTKGDVFDIMCMMDSDAHDIYYEAIDEMEIVFVPISDMQLWVAQNPAMNRSIFAYLGKRVRQLEEVASSICLNNTLVRLSNLLLNNINDKSNELEIIDNLPNNEIASLIGTTRAVVNRHLQELKNYGAISLNRKHIYVEKIAVLQSISKEAYII
ncbi:MAG: Crp/Fnr family transcriptional regulator [Flavobacterium sp.]